MSEEMEQGALSAGCPYCRVLYPEADPCPRCEGGTSFHAAQMLDAESVRRKVVAAADAYVPERGRLDALLRLLFLHRPLSLRALEEHGKPTLDALRRDDARLPEDLRGRSEAELLARFGEPERRDGEVWEYRAPGPSNHVRAVLVLRLREGRVVEQSEHRLPEACDPPA